MAHRDEPSVENKEPESEGLDQGVDVSESALLEVTEFEVLGDVDAVPPAEADATVEADAEGDAELAAEALGHALAHDETLELSDKLEVAGADVLAHELAVAVPET